MDVISHNEVEMLLPWYAAGQLSDSEAERVTAHLAACDQCLDELNIERMLRETIAAERPEEDKAWETIAARVRAGQASQAANDNGFVANLFRRPAALGAAVMMQMALLIMAGFAGMSLSERGGYDLLGSATVGVGADALLMFAPGTEEATMRALLQHYRSRIVDGPTETGAYLVTLPQQDEDRALAGLRASPAVLLAEPIAQ